MTALVRLGLRPARGSCVAVDWEMDPAWLAFRSMGRTGRWAAAGLRLARAVQRRINRQLDTLELDLAWRNGLPPSDSPLKWHAPTTANYLQLKFSVSPEPGDVAFQVRLGWARWWLARCAERR